MWVNSTALQLLGITDTTPHPVNGVIERDVNGHATGQLDENALTLVTNAFPVVEAELFKSGFMDIQSYLNSNGVTTAFDALNSYYASADNQNYYHKLLNQMAINNELTG